MYKDYFFVHNNYLCVVVCFFRFPQDHWDHLHNHCNIRIHSYHSSYYRLWREFKAQTSKNCVKWYNYFNENFRRRISSSMPVCSAFRPLRLYLIISTLRKIECVPLWVSPDRYSIKWLKYWSISFSRNLQHHLRDAGHDIIYRILLENQRINQRRWDYSI